ncbi:MAG: hypothetical protein BMS9Abin32_326 [Gammaproteobacteria bacterium]|nr:MAG: hypothetical protein BMS9Abin32_326 [Gammaproteobacteria bacterium]
MDERMMKAMVAAGAIKKINIIGNGARFHIEANTPNGSITAETRKGKIKTWVTLDAAAKWLRSIGIGTAHISLARWQPGQREFPM